MLMTLRCKWLIALRVTAISSLLIMSGAALSSQTETRRRDDATLMQLSQHNTDIGVIKEKLAENQKREDDREARLRNLEDSRNKIYGAAALITFLFAMLNGFMLILQVKEHLPKRKSDAH